MLGSFSRAFGRRATRVYSGLGAGSVMQSGSKFMSARRLMTHPGVLPITALATETILGDPVRFRDGKAVALSGADSQRTLEWGQATTGRSEQAREPTAAFSLVPSR